MKTTLRLIGSFLALAMLLTMLCACKNKEVEKDSVQPEEVPLTQLLVDDPAPIPQTKP